jgi:hypothetical protein
MKKKLISAGIKAAAKAYKKAASAKKTTKAAAAAKKPLAKVKLTKAQINEMGKLTKSVKAGVAKRVKEAASKKPLAKRTAKAKATNVLKPKPNAFKGVQSAGAARNAPVRAARAARGNKILAGTAAGLGAAAVYNKNKSSASAAASPSAVAPKKAAPKKTASVKIAPYKAKSVVAKSKPRAASFTPTAKKAPLSVSAGKKKVGYVKSKRSLRRR